MARKTDNPSWFVIQFTDVISRPLSPLTASNPGLCYSCWWCHRLAEHVGNKPTVVSPFSHCQHTSSLQLEMSFYPFLNVLSSFGPLFPFQFCAQIRDFNLPSFNCAVRVFLPVGRGRFVLPCLLINNGVVFTPNKWQFKVKGLISQNHNLYSCSRSLARGRNIICDSILAEWWNKKAADRTCFHSLFWFSFRTETSDQRKWKVQTHLHPNTSSTTSAYAHMYPVFSS